MNVLITSASRKVSLIKAFQQALAETEAGQVIAVDASPYSAALYFADHHLLAPRGLGDDFLNFILATCRAYQVKLIVPTRDEELPFFAHHQMRLAEMGVLVMVPEARTVQICQDKKLFAEFCRQHNFAIPRVYEAANIDPAEFPVFVRDQFGKGSRRAVRADTRPELRLILARFQAPLIQEFVPADEYTVDLFADFEGTVISVVPRQRVRTFGGESFVGRVTRHPQIMHEAIRLAITLRLVGHNTFQCFWHNETVKFIEVNPRYGGGAALSFAAGAFTPGYLVRIMRGDQVTPRIDKFTDNLVMLRYTEDIFGIDLEGKLHFEAS